MSTRSSQYRDSRWQRKRLEIMERDNWTCQSCGRSGGVTLNVHHAYYEKGCKPWEYPNESLVTWCEECHEMYNRIIKRIQLQLISCDHDAIHAAGNLFHGSAKRTNIFLSKIAEISNASMEVGLRYDENTELPFMMGDE